MNLIRYYLLSEKLKKVINIQTKDENYKNEKKNRQNDKKKTRVNVMPFTNFLQVSHTIDTCFLKACTIFQTTDNDE